MTEIRIICAHKFFMKFYAGHLTFPLLDFTMDNKSYKAKVMRKRSKQNAPVRENGPLAERLFQEGLPKVAFEPEG